MKKIFLISLLLPALLYSIEIDKAVSLETNEKYSLSVTQQLESKTNASIFGSDLFKGEFKKVRNGVFNPDYEIEVGDKIKVSIWGGTQQTFVGEVDNKGVLFIDGFGALQLQGVKNKDLNSVVIDFLQNTQQDIEAYSVLETTQLIQVFITGEVKNAGLYEGNSDDGLLKFIDMAGGIREGGSYRNISILRNNEIVSSVDLYDFLLDGKINNFLFKSGDVIFINSKKTEISVLGDVFRPFKFEMKEEVSVGTILKKYALLKPEATDFILERSNGKSVIFNKYSLGDKNKMSLKIKNKDKLHVVSDQYSEFMVINISGETYSDKTQIFEIGTTLSDAISSIETNEESDIKNIMVFRKSVAIKQKQLIDIQLDKLEQELYSQDFTTSSEAQLQVLEKKSLVEFIKKARTVKPKGLVVLDKSQDYRNFKLEDGDTIFVPKKTDIIVVQGQVQFPSAHTFMPNQDVEDYIKKSGDFSNYADKSKILVIHKNGTAENVDSRSWFSSNEKIRRGDSIVVMQEVPNNSWQIWKDVTEVAYHIAISTGVLITVF